MLTKSLDPLRMESLMNKLWVNQRSNMTTTQFWRISWIFQTEVPGSFKPHRVLNRGQLVWSKIWRIRIIWVKTTLNSFSIIRTQKLLIEQILPPKTTSVNRWQRRRLRCLTTPWPSKTRYSCKWFQDLKPMQNQIRLLGIASTQTKVRICFILHHAYCFRPFQSILGNTVG